MIITPKQLEALDSLQATKNKGRGVAVIRSILSYLKSNHYSQAVAVAEWDNDKIREYPDIQLMLYDMLPEYYAEAVKVAKGFGWDDPKLTAKKELANRTKSLESQTEPDL